MAPPFSTDRLNAIKKAFEEAGVHYDEDTRLFLLSGVNPRFIDLLRNYSRNLFQLSGDLQALNSVERLSDGTVPFEIWLRNAVDVFAAKNSSQAKVFQQALDEINKYLTGAPSIENPLDLPEIREAIVHKNDMVSYSFLEAGHKAGVSVARLLVKRYDNGIPRMVPGAGPVLYQGTGWLLLPDLIVTNHHVINARNDIETNASYNDFELQALNTKVQFDFNAETLSGIEVGITALEDHDVNLDFALLRLSESLTRNALKIVYTKIEVDESSYIPVNIIQHPGGGPKKVALRNNLVYDSKFPKIRYFTDTDHGSSGSPVLNDDWEVIALHHSATFVENVKFQGRPTGWVNQGTQMIAVLNHIKEKAPSIYERIVGVVS